MDSIIQKINPHGRSRLLFAALKRERTADVEELAFWSRRLEQVNGADRHSPDMQAMILQTVEAVGFSESCEQRLAA